jgi:hypothetical protein
VGSIIVKEKLKRRLPQINLQFSLCAFQFSISVLERIGSYRFATFCVTASSSTSPPLLIGTSEGFE